MRTDLQTESWRMLRDEWARDEAVEGERLEWERQRARTRPEIVAFLTRFIGGEIGVEEFRRTFDRRTRTDWDAFGLRGSSGAMLLNGLAKYARDPVALAEALRGAFRAPVDSLEAEPKLRSLLSLLGDLARPSSAPEIVVLHPAARQSAPAAPAPPLQPARLVFFATMCWHLQEPDRWPAFHLSSRHILHAEEEVFAPTGDPVRDYLAFRESFLSLAGALKLTTWQLEHLCRWQERRLEREGDSETRRALADASLAERRLRRAVDGRRGGRSAAGVPVGGKWAPERVNAVVREAPRHPYQVSPKKVTGRHSSVDHTHVQWLLATVGARLGCTVWIAANDRSREHDGERLGSLSIPELPPLGIDSASQRVVAAIDVVWLTGTRQVAAAFEVEHTTAVYSGLLRLADLVTLSPNLNFPLYIVAPRGRLAKVRRELLRPTFRSMGLDRRCGFFASEALLEAAANLVRWGSDARVIARLAEWVGDGAGDRLL